MSNNNNQFSNFNLNNNNINNFNTFNWPQQHVPYDNLFNVDIKILPNLSAKYRDNDKKLPKRNLFNEQKDYKKEYKEERYIEITKNQKKIRFLQNFGNKIKVMENCKDINYNGEVFIDDYINKVKEVYQDKDSFYDFVEKNGAYNFSQCPFCKGPCVYILEKILCINKCFMTTVGSNTFNDNYTLSNFMEQYKNYYYPNHLKCKADLITLYVDIESKCAEFLCSNCENHYLNFDGLDNM